MSARTLAGTLLLVAIMVSVPGGGSAGEQALKPGVRGVAARAPEGMQIDGDLSQFRDAFATPLE